MIVDHDYRGFRIQAAALRDGDAWNADVRIRRTLSDMKPHVETVTCRKATAQLAEKRAVLYARRWVDRHKRRNGGT
jgi:hypothetical protein